MAMNRKGSVLMITLWILAILVIFALGLGQRAIINLRLARFQRDRLKATCLAKAAINRAIVELEKDEENDRNNPPGYDSLSESWSTGKDAANNNIFENVEIQKDSGENFTVKVTDEESKININTADTDLLTKLFFKELEDADDLAEIIVAWIDSDPETGKEVFKNQPLKTPEELLLVFEYFYKEVKGIEGYQEEAQRVFSAIKDLISVYGPSPIKMNINTASIDVLRILAKSVPGGKDVEKIVSEIDNHRSLVEPFKTQIEINDFVKYFTIDDEKNIYNAMKTKLMPGSSNFNIKVKGYSGNISKNITAIYDRTNDIIVYWHEN